MSVHKKLMQARLALQSGELKKTGHNKFAGYNYFELGDFIPAINKIFAESGLCGLISYGTDIATLTITDTDTNESVTITSPMSTAALKGCHEVQNLGAVQTYIRRYLWVTAMEIIEHDALDGTTGHKDNKPGADIIEAMHNAVKYTIVSPDGKILAEASNAAEAQQKFNGIADKVCNAKLTGFQKTEKIKSLWAANQKVIDSLSPSDKMKMVVLNGDRLNNINKDSAE